MKLLIVRHGDPDYKIDSLTEKGLEGSGIFIGETFPPECKGILCFTAWAGKRYRIPDTEKDG